MDESLTDKMLPSFYFPDTNWIIVPTRVDREFSENICDKCLFSFPSAGFSLLTQDNVVNCSLSCFLTSYCFCYNLLQLVFVIHFIC